MALSRIKQELATKNAEEKRRAREVEHLQQNLLQESKKANRPNVEFLKRLESFFWECARDFSKLTKLKIVKRSRSRFYPLLSTPTINEPELVVYFKPPIARLDYNVVRLKADNRLEFNAHCTKTGSLLNPNDKNYGELHAFFDTQFFDLQEARNWLEAQFENYYENIEDLKNQKL